MAKMIPISIPGGSKKFPTGRLRSEVWSLVLSHTNFDRNFTPFRHIKQTVSPFGLFPHTPSPRLSHTSKKETLSGGPPSPVFCIPHRMGYLFPPSPILGIFSNHQHWANNLTKWVSRAQSGVRKSAPYLWFRGILSSVCKLTTVSWTYLLSEEIGPLDNWGLTNDRISYQ